MSAEHTSKNWHAHNREGVKGWVVAPLHPSGDGSHYAPITQALTEEDARLIASAPALAEENAKLREALEGMCTAVSKHYKTSWLRQQAIDKAFDEARALLGGHLGTSPCGR